ncbi:SDR family NAD(P)-dependent oxidoreductase [Bacillus alkalicellulosilyticus]|uniref:SDR family NAD(P)-dependent oxidoreductase n=1 Tax=Alkalihalobacterium alkalicellulosilyticum TaxID=1912214 RepID=UPI000998AB6E|nr:SDR family NAD(P)-dependent oxidoreductase [Bacillus alkalicellulosilyticus]
MDTILVTGGAGFIGSHVVDQLVEFGKQVIIVDNLSSGKKEQINSSENVTFYQLDIRDSQLADVFARYPEIDGVVHLAAQSKVSPSVEDPNFDASININGTINVLDLARKHGVTHFVYASSAAVYGQTPDLPIVENSPVSPLSPYGVSKLSGEEYVKAYGRLYQMSVYALRFANVFGPRQSAATEAGVITIFIEQLLNQQQPTIQGDGQQTRDFVYVEDVARAVVACLQAPPSSDGSAVYNVSTCEEVSIEQLLRELCRILEIDYDPHYAAERIGDIKYSYLSNQKIMEQFNLHPQTPFREGLQKTVGYYQKK